MSDILIHHMIECVVILSRAMKIEDLLMLSAIFIPLIFIVFIIESRCPKCKRFFAKQMKTKSDKISNDQESIDIKIRYYQCKYCNHLWGKKIKNETSMSGKR